MMCTACGHTLDSHYSWSFAGRSGDECAECLYVSEGVYAATGNGHAIAPPKGYAVAAVSGEGKGMKRALVTTASMEARR